MSALHKEPTTKPIAEDIAYHGRNGEYLLTVYDDGRHFRLYYPAVTIYATKNFLQNYDIERRQGEGGELQRWLSDELSKLWFDAKLEDNVPR